MIIKIHHNNTQTDLEIDEDTTVQTLLFQIFSLTEIPPDEISIQGRSIDDEDTMISEWNLSSGDVLTIIHSKPSVLSESEIELMAQSCDFHTSCSRIFFGALPLNQPAFAVNGAQCVCVACATTCHLPNTVQPAFFGSGSASQPFLCQCQSIHSACLFQSRIDSGFESLQVGPVRNRVNTLIKTAGDNQQSMLKQHIDMLKQQQFLQQSSGESQENQQFLGRIQGAISQVKGYENKQVQAKALEIIPVKELNERALAIPDVNFNDELMRQLLKWYKEEFFTWVNAPPCDHCGADTEMLGMTQPFQNELTYGASRVELYKCNSCQQQTRFPRYNDPVKLLDTRRGRCGEWANCFTLLCRAMGFEARLVNDWTDHVWTEVWCEAKQTFVHTDCCENAYDAPLTYEAGWGKKLNYIVATSIDEILDVTKRYTQSFDDVLTRRTIVSEDWLASTLERIESSVQSNLDSQRQSLLARRRVRELKELNGEPREELAEAEKIGRISGSSSWKAQRGEDGKDGVGNSSSSLSSSTSSSSSSTSPSISFQSTPIEQFRVFDSANHDKIIQALLSSSNQLDQQDQLDLQSLDDLCDIVNIMKLRSQNIRGTHPLEAKHFNAWQNAFISFKDHNKQLLPLLDLSRLAIRHPNAITHFSSSSSSSFDLIQSAIDCSSEPSPAIQVISFRLFSNAFGLKQMESSIVNHTPTFISKLQSSIDSFSGKTMILIPMSALMRNLAIQIKDQQTAEQLLQIITSIISIVQQQLDQQDNDTPIKGIEDLLKDILMAIVSILDKHPETLGSIDKQTLLTLSALSSHLPDSLATDLATIQSSM